MTIASFEIGTTSTLTNIEALGTPDDRQPNMPPLVTYYAYAESVPTADGGMLARGAPRLTWTWGSMPGNLFDALRTICPNGSASVYIRSFVPDAKVYKYFTGVMQWPPLDSYKVTSAGPTYTGKRTYERVEITFTNLVEYTP